MLARVLLLRAK